MQPFLLYKGERLFYAFTAFHRQLILKVYSLEVIFIILGNFFLSPIEIDEYSYYNEYGQKFKSNLFAFFDVFNLVNSIFLYFAKNNFKKIVSLP